MQGGEEPPCQPAALLRVIEEETGHPCPRRESYNVDDGACLELLGLAAAPALAPLFDSIKEALFEGLDTQHQLTLLRRVAAAFADEKVASFLPKRFI